jgi:hypothetical protein
MANTHLRFSPARPNPTLRRSLLPVSAMSSTSATKSDDISSSSLEVIGARRSLLFRFASLQRSYVPFPLLGWNRHVETIFAAFCRSLPVVKLKRECLRTKDDGAIALDWVLGDETELPFDSPLLILLVVSLLPFSVILVWCVVHSYRTRQLHQTVHILADI